MAFSRCTFLLSLLAAPAVDAIHSGTDNAEDSQDAAFVNMQSPAVLKEYDDSMDGMWDSMFNGMGDTLADVSEDIDPPKPAKDCTGMDHVPYNVASFYINLDRRTDRKATFETNMKSFFDLMGHCRKWTITRHKATTAEGDAMNAGQIAAARSHVGLLNSAPAGNVFIFEDDFHFTEKPKEVVHRMETALSHLGDKWNVLMFGDNSYENGEMDEGAHLMQTKGAWCSEAYLVKKEYRTTLSSKVTEGLKKMVEGHVDQDTTGPLGPAFDTLWHPLQMTDSWYVMRPRIGEQNDVSGDSDALRARSLIDTSHATSEVVSDVVADKMFFEGTA